MGLIAIDKHHRKILGYLCKNDQTVAYCCSECDVEFTAAPALEMHMVTHDKSANNHCCHNSIEDFTDDVPSKADPPLDSLSVIEKENLLKRKYQVIFSLLFYYC